MHPLEGVLAKVGGAVEHLQTLEREWRTFLDAHPLKTEAQFDAKTGWYVERLQPVTDPPLRCSVIAGDLFHCLRSALNYLAWQIVDRFGSVPPGDRTAFPIFTDAAAFKSAVTVPAKKGKGPLGGLQPGTEPWALIESKQPYHGRNPDAHPLELIRVMNNVDKHKTLHFSWMRSDGEVDWLSLYTWHPSAGDPLEWDFPFGPRERFIEGAVVARFRFRRPGPLNPHVDMKGQLPIAIQLGDATDSPSGIDLAQLVEYVALLGDAAQPLFGS